MEKKIEEYDKADGNIMEQRAGPRISVPMTLSQDFYSAICCLRRGTHERHIFLLGMVDDDTQSKLSSYRCGGQARRTCMITCTVYPRFRSTLFWRLVKHLTSLWPEFPWRTCAS